jgi:hypothetical protein
MNLHSLVIYFILFLMGIKWENNGNNWEFLGIYITEDILTIRNRHQ